MSELPSRTLPDPAGWRPFELLAGVRGLQLRSPLSPSPAGRIAVAAVAQFAGEPGPDIYLAPVLESARALLAGDELRKAVESTVGTLR